MNIRDAYSNWSVTYDSDRNLTRDLDQIVTRQTLSPHHYQAILEIGCGTGKNTALLGQLGDRVCSLDFSAGMILQAKAKIQSDGARANILFAVTDLTLPWPCAGQSVDLITCNLVLEHIWDLDFIFAEGYRVLARGGHFFVCELHPFRQYQGTKARFQRGHTEMKIPAFVHHISDFIEAAETAGFRLASFREWWHEDDGMDNARSEQKRPPRLVSFLFEK